MSLMDILSATAGSSPFAAPTWPMQCRSEKPFTYYICKMIVLSSSERWHTFRNTHLFTVPGSTLNAKVYEKVEHKLQRRPTQLF